MMKTSFRLMFASLLIASSFGNILHATPQTSLSVDPDLGEEMVCVEGAILDMAVQYNGNASTMVYEISSVTLDVTDNAGAKELVWSMTAVENSGGPGLPTGDYKLPMSCSMATFGMDDPTHGDYGGGTWDGDDDNGFLAWTTAVDPIEISGMTVINMSKLPQVMTFSFTDGSELHVYLVADCGATSPGPVTHLPITAPIMGGEGGGGDGEDCGGGGDPTPGDEEEECNQCDTNGSGRNSIPGASAGNIIREMRSFGGREDFRVLDCDKDKQCKSGCNNGGGFGGLQTGPQRPMVNIRRRLTPHELTSCSSFGLGWYSETDYAIEFYPETENDPNTILFFDPMTEMVHEMVDFDGTSEDGVYNHTDGPEYFTSFELFSDSTYQTAATDPEAITSLHASGTATYLYGKLTRRNGWVYKFKVLDVSPFANEKIPFGRLISIENPEGFAKTFTYNTGFTTTELQEYPQRLLQIATVGDSGGNTANYTYEDDPRGGRYVVERIEIDLDSSDGTDDADVALNYEYDTTTDRLAEVSRDTTSSPIVLSSYTYGQDTPWDAMTITSEENRNEFICPNESTALLSNDLIVYEGELINQFAARLMGREDGNGFRYMVVYRGEPADPQVPGDPDNSNLYRIEYRGDLIEWSVGVYQLYYESYTINSQVTGFDKFEDLAAEPTYPLNTASTNEKYLMGQPDSCMNATGYEKDMLFDSAGNVTAIVHPVDGTIPASFEKFAYNSRNQMTMHRDREGYANLYDYDSDGNLIRIGRGLKDSNTTSNPASTSYSTIEPVVVSSTMISTMEVFEYYTSGSSAGMLKSSALTSYVEPTDPSDPSEATAPAALKTTYTYNSKNRLYQVTKPKPAGVSTAPVVTYDWVDGRLDKITDEVGNETEYDYDELDRLIRVTYDDGSTEDTWYDDANNKVYTKDRNDIVSWQQRDSSGRLTNSHEAYGTDSDLSDHAISTLTGIGNSTVYYYHPGKLRPYKTVTSNRTTLYEYDYRGRLIATSQSIGSGQTDARITTTEYVNNRVFRTTEGFSLGSEEFARQTYRGYSDDNTNVRIIECRDDSTTFTDNGDVMTEVRPDYDDPTSELRIVDRITDMRGATFRLVDERGIMTDYEVDALGRTTKMQAGLQGIGGEPLMMETVSAFDFRGNVTSTTDPLGNTTVMTYDDAGNLATRDVADGETYEMSYSYEYDPKGRKIEETLPSTGINTSYYKDCCGRQQGSKNAEGEGRVTVMNSGGQVVYEAGVTSTFDFETDAYADIPSAKKLSETTRRYDAAGRLKFQTVWKEKISGSIDASNPPIARDGTKTAGVTTQYAWLNQLPYSAFGGPSAGTNVTVDRLQTSSTSDTFVISLYNALNALSGEGVTLSLTRPGSANITISPDEKTYSYSISDSLGRNVMSGLSYGPETTEGTLNDLINWTITKYDDSDTVSSFPVEVVTSIDIDNYQTQRLTDAFGWTLSSKQIETSPSRTNTTLTDFDISGNPLKVTDANGNIVEYVYDPLGRRTSTTADPGTGTELNLVTTTEYFGDTGLVKKTVDANGNEINYVAADYDVMGRLLNLRDRIDDVVSGDNYTEHVYDDEGNMTMIIDAENNATVYDHDLLGRRVLTTYPDGKQEIIEYDGLGRRESVRTLGVGETVGDASDGIKQEFVYKYAGPVEEVTFTDQRQSISDKHLFGYDAFLRRTSSENEIDSVKQTFTYTDRGQLKTEQLDYDTVASTNPLFTTTYSYNDHGQLESIVYPSSTHEVTYTFTDRSQLATVEWDDGTANQIESRSYDPGGRLTDIDRDNFDEARSYDAANRLTGITNQDPGVSVNADQIGDLTYAWDANGNKQGESWSNGPTALSDWDFTTVSGGSGDYLNGYDEEDRLRRFIRSRTGTPTEAIADIYMNRDAPGSDGTIGNIKNLTGGAASQFNGNRSYSDIYELTSIGSTPLTQTYNLDGQVTTMHNGNDLEWDAAGRLKQVDNGTDIYIYGYDCDGRRVWKKEQGASTFTVYCYGGPNVISEITITIGTPDTDAVEKEFVYGTTIDELLLVDDGTTQHGVTRNQQWSVMAAYNYATGAIVGRFNYDLFGKRFILDEDGTLASNQDDDFGVPYGYTSRRHDSESGLMYFRARYYDPTTGEFISKDPLEYVDGMSMFRGYFVPKENDPTGKLRFRPNTPRFKVCGGLTHIAQWRLDEGEDDGIVIQLVCFSRTLIQCPNGNPRCEAGFGGSNGRVCPTNCYLEIWEVNDRQFQPAGTDTYFFPACRNSRGVNIQSGIAIFVPTEWIQNNGFGGVSDEFVSGPNGVVNAGNLRSACYSDAGPANFFNTAFTEFGKHSASRFSTVGWDCCCGRRENLVEISFAVPTQSPTRDTQSP